MATTMEEFYARLKGPQIEAAKAAKEEESNDTSCPLCKQGMEPTLLLSDRKALYCQACKVTQPLSVL